MGENKMIKEPIIEMKYKCFEQMTHNGNSEWFHHYIIEYENQRVAIIINDKDHTAKEVFEAVGHYMIEQSKKM